MTIKFCYRSKYFTYLFIIVCELYCVHIYELTVQKNFFRIFKKYYNLLLYSNNLLLNV